MHKFKQLFEIAIYHSKEIILYAFVGALLLFIGSGLLQLSKENIRQTTVTKQDATINAPPIVVDEEINENKEEKDEERAIALFKKCWEQYEKDGLNARLDYKQLEDIYKQYPNNKTIGVLYHFCTSVDYYSLSSLLEKREYIENSKNEAAKIPLDYNGAYSKEIIDYVQILLGEQYTAISEKAKRKPANKKSSPK